MIRFGKGVRALALGALCACASAVGAQQPMEATTAGGDRILLHPDGRWEYADPKKRAESPLRPTAAAAQPGAGPAQGGLFGIGRTILPGDPEYNLGSLSGKGR
jgi:hypothetical protein